MCACLWLSSDDISGHLKRRKNYIMKLRHRHALPLTRPAVSSRGGTLTGLEKAAQIEPNIT